MEIDTRWCPMARTERLQQWFRGLGTENLRTSVPKDIVSTATRQSIDVGCQTDRPRPKMRPSWARRKTTNTVSCGPGYSDIGVWARRWLQGQTRDSDSESDSYSSSSEEDEVTVTTTGKPEILVIDTNVAPCIKEEDDPDIMNGLVCVCHACIVHRNKQ